MDIVKEQSEKTNFKEIIQIITRKEVLLMYVVIFAYVAAEIGIATWMVEFVQKSKGCIFSSRRHVSFHTFCKYDRTASGQPFCG